MLKHFIDGINIIATKLLKPFVYIFCSLAIVMFIVVARPIGTLDVLIILMLCIGYVMAIDAVNER